MNTINEAAERSLEQRRKDMEAEALEHNAGRKPKFGDEMRNPWASLSSPQRDGYFVRSKRITGRLNPGLWYEMTDGAGKFWETNGKTALFTGGRATLPQAGAEAVDGPHTAFEKWFGVLPENPTTEFLAVAYWAEEAWHAAWEMSATQRAEPAPEMQASHGAVAPNIIPWQDRMAAHYAQGSVKMYASDHFMQQEIDDWRAHSKASADSAADARDAALDALAAQFSQPYMEYFGETIQEAIQALKAKG